MSIPKTLISCRVPTYKPFESIAFAHLAELGIRFVEIRVPEADQLDAVKQQLDAHQLTVATLHGRCDVSREDCVTDVLSQMPALLAFDCDLFFVSIKLKDTPREDAFPRIRAAADICASHNASLIIETHPELFTNGDLALQSLQAIDHPAVKLNYDTANIHFYNERADSAAELEKVIEHVAAMHLKDCSGLTREWNFPALGRGIVDFREIFQILDAHDFRGPCTLEIEGVEGEERTERVITSRIAESLGFLRGLGRV